MEAEGKRLQQLHQEFDQKVAAAKEQLRQHFEQKVQVVSDKLTQCQQTLKEKEEECSNAKGMLERAKTDFERFKGEHKQSHSVVKAKLELSEEKVREYRASIETQRSQLQRFFTLSATLKNGKYGKTKEVKKFFKKAFELYHDESQPFDSSSDGEESDSDESSCSSSQSPKARSARARTLRPRGKNGKVRKKS